MTSPSAAVVARAAIDLEGAPPQEILRWALDMFHPRLAIASSMTDSVLVHMASKIQPGVPVIFLDTGYHFVQTLATRNAVIASYAADILTIAPHRTVAEQDAAFGPRLYERDPDLCCRMRKVEPLEIALASYDAWASGIRRDEGWTRHEVPVIALDKRRGKVKVNPLATWTQSEVDDYITENDVIVHPLLGAGYSSIGCEPCTRRIAPGERPRDGRWTHHGKTECGLHT